jgi:hypothetical protein
MPPVHVVGQYVVLGKGGDGDTPEQATSATVVDTRSGAVTFLPNVVAGADGGTIAMRLAPNPAKGGASTLGVIRSDALPRSPADADHWIGCETEVSINAVRDVG